MKFLNGIKIAFSDKKYLALFAALAAAFAVLYIFSWNLILLLNFYVRADLWTLPNIAALAAIAVLSALVVTLVAFNLRMKMCARKGKYGVFSIVPALLTSACPTCAPLLFSFTSATFAIGIGLAQFNDVIKVATIPILLATTLYLSSCIGKCSQKGGRRSAN